MVRELDDGRFETTLTVEASKFYADGLGEETKAELAASIEVGVFTERPGSGEFDTANVLMMERRDIADGEQKIVIVTDKRPEWAGIDPYNKFIDRNSDDNLTPIS